MGMLLTTAHQFPLRQQAGDFISDLASQRLQIDQRASSRQLLLMLAGQCFHHLLHPRFQPTIHCPALHRFPLYASPASNPRPKS